MSKAWDEKMSELYSDRKKNLILKYMSKVSPKVAEKLGGKKVSDKTEMKVWFGTMDAEAKAKRQLSYAALEAKTEELLSKGYRLVKSSAITPKGVYSLNGAPKEAGEPNASNLFFELKPQYEEFVNIYDRFGRYENNFPDYFPNKEVFEAYVRSSDIFMVEDVKTNKPVGFVSYNLIEAGSPEAEEYKSDCGLEIKNKLVYNDTVALYSELHGKGIGRLVNDIVDGYYLRVFGTECDYGLYTGEINTNANGALSKHFHEKRGFGNWVESRAPFSKWKERYRSMKEKAQKFKGNYADFLPGPSYNSYRGQ